MDRFLVILVNGYLSQAELKIILSKAMIKFKIIENNEIFIINYIMLSKGRSKGRRSSRRN